MADYLVTDTELTSVANAIRTKGGTSADLSFPTEFVSAIEAIATGKRIATGTYTATSNVTSGYVTIETVANLGFTPRYVILYRTNIPSAQNHIFASLKIPKHGSSSGWSIQVRRGSSMTTFSVSFGSGGINPENVGDVGVRNNEIQYRADSSRILGADTYYWIAIEE